MPFEAGHKKFGGRGKGTPNNKTKEFKDFLGDFQTVRKMIGIFETTKDESIKVAICKEFLKYEFPQRKAVEMIGDVEMPIINIKGIKI